MKKTILIYGTVCAVFLFAWVGISIALTNDGQGTEAIPAAQTTITAGTLLAEVNMRRAEAGVAPLTVDTRLANSAQAKSTDMKSRNYFEHTDPDGKHGYELIWEHYPKDEAAYASENLQGMCARDDTKAIVDAWMASEPHKKALLDSKYTITGFGISLDNSNQEDEYCNGNVVEHFVEVAKQQPTTVQYNNYSSPSVSRPSYAPTTTRCTHNDYGGYFEATTTCRTY